MSSPLVSVLIPAYNAQRWIRETLESALAQTWRPLEIVVVDDGSRDDTVALVQGLRAPEIRLVRQENRGQSAAENRALSLALGEFIQYLDADDVISADKIRIQVDRLRGREECIAWGEWARFYSAPSEAVFELGAASNCVDPIGWLVDAFTGGEPMMQAGIWLLPRKVLDAAGPWNEGLSLINDFEYFCRVLLAARGVVRCPGARLLYRSGVDGTLSGSRSPAAWRSALMSLTLGTDALLSREDSPRVRRACADVFRTLEFQSYPDSPDVSAVAMTRVRDLGGSRLRPPGGSVFRAASTLVGWRAARRFQRIAYCLGYAPIARWKGRRLRASRLKSARQ